MPNDLQRATYRILDASANRAGEGLRTLEEYARFGLDDPVSSAEFKSLRHDLAAAMGLFDRQSLILARDTQSDVGTEIGVETEYQRDTAASVIAAAATRTQQSLRVIEEYSKTINPTISQQVEQIRYRCYSVSGQLELGAISHVRSAKLAQSQLYALIDAGESDDAFASTVKTLASGGVDILQLREQGKSDRTVYQRAKIGSQIARQFGTLFIVNDRADLALAADADGVHVGQDELPAAAARKIVGQDRLVGVSTHDVNQVHEAIRDGANYIGCGPVFASQTKSFDRYVGPEFLREVHQATKATPLPAFAIGGITIDNVDQVVAAGFHRIAVTGALRDTVDAKAAIGQLQERLGR